MLLFRVRRRRRQVSRLSPLRHQHGGQFRQRLKENWQHLGLKSKWLRPTTRTQRISWRDRARSWPGYTFFSGFYDGVPGVFIMTMEGEVVHRWPFSLDEMWQVAGMRASRKAGWNRDPRAVLLPNGDVVMNVAGGAFSRIDRWRPLRLRDRHRCPSLGDVLPDGSAMTTGQWMESERRADRPQLWPVRTVHTTTTLSR